MQDYGASPMVDQNIMDEDTEDTKTAIGGKFTLVE